jgi:hypothetical protein
MYTLVLATKGVPVKDRQRNGATGLKDNKKD